MKYALLSLIGLMFLSGCATLDSQVHPRITGSQSAEDQLIATRPQEQGLKYLGRTSGSATSKKLLGIFEIGDDSRLRGDIVMVGKRTEGWLEETAAYRAADAKSADALYKLKTHTENYNFIHPMIYRTKKVNVYCMAYEIEDLGPFDIERADNLRKDRPLRGEAASAPKDSAPEGSGLISGILYGIILTIENILPF